MLYKNVASQKWVVFAYTTSTSEALAGDAANITAKISIDGAAGSATNDVNPTELENGYYVFDLTQAETNGGLILILPESSTSGVSVIGSPASCYTNVLGATAAANLEDMFDGTGYTDDNAPATQAQVGVLSAGSSSGFNFPVSADNTAGAIIDSVTFVGTQTGTYANTEANAATFHQITHATNAFDLVYRIAAGATNLFTSVTVDAYMTSSNDTASIQLYDHIGSDWETVSTITGTNGTGQTEYAITPFAKHTGALGTSEAGNIYIRFITSAQTSPELYISKVFGTAVAATSTMGYEGGQVWVDEDNGSSTGTTQGVDGIFANQCDDFDNGQTIADNLGTAFIHIHPGNSITLTAALQGYNISNVQATLNGGSQNADSTRVTGGFIAGTWARAGTGIVTFVGCSMTSVTADRCALLDGCGIVGTFTLSEAGLYPIVDAQAGGATGIATIDFASLGGATVNMEGWKGNLTITNMASGDTLNLHAAAGGDIVLGGADGTVNISGVVGSVTDNRTGSPTLSDVSVAARFTGIEGTTFSTSTDSLEAIRDRGDSAWTTGAGGSDRLLMVDTTIATLSTQTSFTLTSGSADDDAYNNCTIVVEDVSTSTQKAVGMVLDYVGSTRTVTLKEALSFTIAATDKVYILAENSLKSTVANRQLDVTATGAAGIDWGNVENPSTAVDLSGTDIQLADTVTTLTGHTVQTGDSYALLGTPAGADVSADIAAVKAETANIVADTNELQTDLANGGRLDLLIDAIKVVTDALGSSGATQLSLSANQIISFTVDTATNSHTPTTTEFQADDITEATADHYNGRIIIWTSGNLEGQATSISDYAAVGGIGQFTVVALTEAPANNDTGIIL